MHSRPGTLPSAKPTPAYPGAHVQGIHSGGLIKKYFRRIFRIRKFNKALAVTREAEQTIVDTLLTYLPQGLCRGIEEGLVAAGERAWLEASRRHEGHMPNALGQARHFHSNEQFAVALDIAGVQHNPLCGNDIIVGQVGSLLVGRFATSNRNWNNARRSTRRLELASHNQWLERLVQPGLFGEQVSGTHIAVFFVSIFSSNVKIQPERPLSVEIAVMDTTLSERLFSEPLAIFLSRFAQPAEQPDLVRVRLKSAAKKQQDSQS